MKIKNRQLNKETIAFINTLLDKEINAVAAFKLMKVAKTLDEIAKNKQQSEVNLIKKFAEKDETGNIKRSESNPENIDIKEENIENFNKELNDLNNYENEVDFEPLTIEELGLEKCSANDLMKIEFLLKI